MANNLSGISYTNNFNNLDGLSIVQADQIYVDGTSIDPTNLVPYTGASKTTDLGSQNIKTTRLPTANADLTNKLYVDSAVTTGSGDTLGIVNLNFVRYSGSISDTDLGTYKISSSAVPTTANHLTNKTYVDGAITTATSNKVPYTGATSNVVLTGTNKFQQSYNATVSDTTTVVNRQTLDSAIAGLGAGILNLNNTWGYGNTNDMNGAFASIQPQIANQTNLATGGSDFIGTMPICVLTKPSTYYNLSGAGALGMSVGLDLGYTGGSFTAGASTTITGSWTANTVSNRIATITFDVTSHIGKSLNCVWEGVTPLVFATSPPPFFTVVNGSTTVYSSPQPISGTNTYVWNFTPTVGTTTITYTVQSTGTPSLPAFSWTRFSIKQIGASYLAYKAGAKYTATFTNLLGSQNMSFYVYQYNTFGASGVSIGDIFAIPVTTSGQTITITFTPNSGGNTGPIIFFFQPSSANQYVRFDTATLKRADMTIAGNIQSAVTVNSQIISANPTGNSGNGTVINMNAFNGAFGSIEAFNNANTTKLPIALNAYGGNVGIGRTDPSYTLDVSGDIRLSGDLYMSLLKKLYVYYISSTNNAGLVSNSSGDLSLFTGTSGTANRITVLASGNVGVANAAPSGTLDVSGIIRMGNYTGGNYDNIQFLRGTGTSEYPNIRCQDNYFGLYVSSAGGWCSDSQVSDMVMRPALSFRVGINGASSSLVCHSNSNVGINIATPVYKLDVAGSMRVKNGDDSMTYYGANTSWSSYLVVGSGTTKQGVSTAQCISTNGNLHLDGGNNNSIYYGYYANSNITPNDHRFYGSNMYLATGLPQQNNIYAYPLVLGDSGQIGRSQAIAYQVIAGQSLAWGGGQNMTYAFYKYNNNVSVSIRGKLSYYVSGSTRAYPTLRVYSQSYGIYWYFSFEAFTNNTYNHLTFPFEIVLPGNGYPYAGFFDIYIYNNGNCITDTNDQLWVATEVLPGSAW